MSKENAIRLPIHFNVPEHSLLGSDYVVAIESFITCIDELNKRLFDNQLQVELRVLTNDDGSIKAVTGIAVTGIKNTVKFTAYCFIALGVLSKIIQATETESFKALVKGYTGHELNHAVVFEATGKLLHDATVGIFSQETEELRKKIPANVNLDKALKAKSNFYSMSIKNKDIKSIGFDDTEEFPIKRNRFAYHTSKDMVRSIESEFKVYEAIIVSPVDTDQDIKWHLKDVLTGHRIKALMRDDPFKRDFLNGNYPLKQTSDDDKIKVLVEYKRQEKNGDMEIKETSIHTVYIFNDVDIAPIPDNIDVYSKDIRPMDDMLLNHC